VLEAHLEIKSVKERSMLEEALSQVTCKLPSARDTFESLSKLSLVIILNQISKPMFSKLPFIHHARNNVSKIEEQYRQVPFVDLKEAAPFKKDGLPLDTEQFWIGVLQHKACKELAIFSLTCLITPYAVVERIFSLVSSVKTKARNRMQLNLLMQLQESQQKHFFQADVAKTSPHLQKCQKTKHWTRFMPFVPIIFHWEG
jgi:hypothetical protein